jgi:hypothetical protein
MAQAKTAERTLNLMSFRSIFRWRRNFREHAISAERPEAMVPAGDHRQAGFRIRSSQVLSDGEPDIRDGLLGTTWQTGWDPSTKTASKVAFIRGEAPVEFQLARVVDVMHGFGNFSRLRRLTGTKSWMCEQARGELKSRDLAACGALRGDGVDDRIAAHSPRARIFAGLPPPGADRFRCRFFRLRQTESPRSPEQRCRGLGTRQYDTAVEDAAISILLLTRLYRYRLCQPVHPRRSIRTE